MISNLEKNLNFLKKNIYPGSPVPYRAFNKSSIYSLDLWYVDMFMNYYQMDPQNIKVRLFSPILHLTGEGRAGGKIMISLHFLRYGLEHGMVISAHE